MNIPWFGVALAAFAALVLWIGGATLFGYPRAQIAGALLGRREQAIVAACADALFPPGGPIPVSGTEAGLVAYMNGYLARLPRTPRILARLLLASVELGPWVFGPRVARFTRLGLRERAAFLRAMGESSLYFRRISFLSLRTMMTMGYLAHPDVAARMHVVADPTPFEHGEGHVPGLRRVLA
jgi:hypothetical protein